MSNSNSISMSFTDAQKIIFNLSVICGKVKDKKELNEYAFEAVRTLIGSTNIKYRKALLEYAVQCGFPEIEISAGLIIMFSPEL